MAFRQSSGPPATGKQLNELLELLEAAGHSDFRDARGPMGFTQRQAGGKFSRDEADEFIEQLQIEVYGDGPPSGSKPSAARSATASRPSKIARRQPPDESAPTKKPAATRKAAAAKPTSTAAAKKSGRSSSVAEALQKVSTELLVAELERRGRVVLDPH